MRDARSERRIRVPSVCWRRLAGAMSTCPIERRAASGRVRVGAPLKETLHLRGRRADLTGRTSLRAASGVARSGDGAIERPAAKDYAYRDRPANRAQKHPLHWLRPPTLSRSWTGFGVEGEPCVIGAPSVRCCRVARAVAKTPIARRAEPTHARRGAARGPLLHVNLLFTCHLRNEAVSRRKRR